MSHVDEGTLHAYLDGELPSTDRATVEAHLAQCETCRARLVEERALLERASALLGAARPAEQPVPPFEQLRKQPKRSLWRVRTSFAWAASIALALGVGYLLNELPERRAAPETLASRAVDEERAAAPAAAAEHRDAPTPQPQPATPARRERLLYQQKPSDASAQALSMGRVDSGDMRVATRAAPRAGPPSTVASAAPAAGDSVGRMTEVPPAVHARLQSTDVLSERKVSASTWPRIDRQTATAILGEDPVGLPDLMTRSYRRSPDREGVVVVEQALDDRTVIQIFQQQSARANARFDSLVYGGSLRGYTALGDRERADRLARFVGKLRVEIGGPVSVDSLNRLLEQVAPLP